MANAVGFRPAELRPALAVGVAHQNHLRPSHGIEMIWGPLRNLGYLAATWEPWWHSTPDIRGHFLPTLPSSVTGYTFVASTAQLFAVRNPSYGAIWLKKKLGEFKKSETYQIQSQSIKNLSLIHLKSIMNHDKSLFIIIDPL
jgi:hypothetical protein